GTDLESLLDDERRQKTVEEFLASRFYPAISITRRMLWDSYVKNRSEFSTDKKVQMQIIAAPFKKFLADPEAKPGPLEMQAAIERAESTINEAARALNSGERFDDVARRLSRGIKGPTGGIWPMMTENSFRESEVETVAFELPEGKVSEIIETQTGYYIVKARKVQAGQTVSFEDAQETIEQELREEQYLRLQKEYLKRLLKGAHIRKSEEFLKLAIDRAVKTYLAQ
ncbi:MAG: peptidylprolyl isomerase, partial [Planctomycetota bacterium]